VTTGRRDDPVRAHNFVVAFADSAADADAQAPNPAGAPAGGFAECSGLGSSVDVEDYREGGRNGGVRHFATRTTWSNIRLRRGIASSHDLWRWYESWVAGRGKRRDGVIVLQNDRGEPVRRWEFRRAIPVKWAGPSLDAAQSRVAIEELELAHEGLVER
jgi:phage tail-like protein